MKEKEKPNLHPRTTWGLFFLLLVSSAYFHHPVEYDNTASRYYLLSAVVDYGRLDIDMYKNETIGVSVAQDHTYSNKAIGAPLVAAPVYWALRNLTPIRHDRPLSRRAQYLCRVLTTTLPYAIAGAVLFRLLLSMGVAATDAFLAVLAYAFGTIAWIHATLFSGHQMAANFSFLSFALIWFMTTTHRVYSSFPSWMIAGLLAGLGGLADYTALYLAVVLAVYAWVKSERFIERMGFLAGGAVTAAALMLYNQHCFGGPFSMSYAHLGYGEFAEGSRQGLLGVSLPDPMALLSLLATPARGLFFIMPVVLFAIPGFWTWMKQRSYGPEARVVGAVVIGYWFINAGFYGWHGGWTFGPRYLVPMLPFLAIPAAFAIHRGWFAPLFLFSVLQIGAAQVVMPHTPEEFRNPIVECIYPLWRYGYQSLNPGMKVGLNGLVSILPWLAAAVAAAWAIRPRRSAPSSAASALQASWQPVYALACMGIIAGLVSVRTASYVDAHFYKYRLLGNAAYVLSSESLARAAMIEGRMARRPVRS